MNPILLLIPAAAAAVVIANKKPATPTPVAPEIKQAATGLARSRIAKGATPEEAAAWAADKISSQGGGFWKGKTSSGSDASRF
jgi:hypothetical protein